MEKFEYCKITLGFLKQSSKKYLFLMWTLGHFGKDVDTVCDRSPFSH